MEATPKSPAQQAPQQSLAPWHPSQARMSFFTKPITNKHPQSQPLSLFEVYQLVRTNRYKPETRELRTLTDEESQRAYKGSHLDYITPSGTFSYCADTSLLVHSQVICIDLDHLGARTEEMFHSLIADPVFETLLLFRSPRGEGLKWFVHIDLARADHRSWYLAIRNYLMATYQLGEKQVDKQCQNPSRPCFLCHDPEAYLRTDLIEFF